MSIRAVIFDLGGVLVRTEDRMPRARLAANLGLTYDELNALVFDSQSAYQAMKGEITTAEHWESIRESLRVSKGDFSQFPLEFWAGDFLDQDLIKTLRNLRSDYKTALLSNAFDDLRQQIEEIWKIDDAFDQILISAEVGMMKPDPLIFQKMLSDLEVKPVEAVFVDDFPQNIAAAKAAGLEVIHFLGSNQTLEDLRILLDGK